MSLPASAEAGGAIVHPDLTRAIDQLEQANGPEAYSALRRIWSTWDRANPVHVEEALRAAEGDRKLAPATRVYAGMLQAFARSRRGDLAAERKKISALGFIDDWLVLGPFDNEGKAGFDGDSGPEADFSRPIVIGQSYTGKERPVIWRQAPAAAFPFGWLDSGALFRPERFICIYAKTFVRSKASARAPRAVTLWAGAAGAFRAYWNGRVVLKDTAYRGHDPERFAQTVRLKAGTNDLTVKVCGADIAPILSVRIGDRKGGPDAEVEVTSDLSASVAAAKNLETSDDKATDVPKPRPGEPLGPMQAFQKLTDQKKPKPSDLFAHAEYLVRTSSDDPTEHIARNLAHRAAEAEPKIDRLLLAANLVEDRNQVAEWIDKAQALADKRKEPNIQVLLAQAILAQNSQNWRLAFPFFDRVLAIDPDNVRAIQGRVELYNEAGLRRTALATLERAVGRQPHSVTLLNMYASQLDALGRATEANEVKQRYANLRFDDMAFLGGKVELSVTRRSRGAAEHWLDRLRTVDPDSQWGFGLAARTYERLGQTDRAIATYERALSYAPEDVGTLRELSDLHGRIGHRDEQLALLKRILEIRPQEKDVREYVEHIVPPKPRPDEAYAWAADRFLRKRHAPADGQNRRTMLDLTVTTVFENGLSSEFRQVVFQPLTNAAAANARQYSFHYQGGQQTVTLRGARVHRKDNSIDEAVESGEGPANDPAIAMYTSGRNFYVQFPRLEPGDVVELRYRIDDVTPRNEFADYYGAIQYMQSNEPVGHAEYVLITPKKRKFVIHSSKLPKLQVTQKEKGNQRTYRFIAKDVPALLPEPAMPPWPEVLGYVHVSTFENWKALGTWYWGLSKDQFDLDDATRKIVQDVTKNAKTDLEKVRAVYGWVVKNTRYVALEFGIYGFKPRRCVQTVARGWGDCKDKATVIVSMLRELGIPATIVILRTGLRGDFDAKVASLAPFDHAIAYVPSLKLYLDGTAEYTGSDELPTMDLGARGLLVNEGDTKLVRLPDVDPGRAVRARELAATVKKSGEATLDVSYDTSGASAPSWRRRYHAKGTRRERLTQDIGREFPGFQLAAGPTAIVANDLEDIEQAVKIRVRGAAPAFGRAEGKQLSMAVTPNHGLTSSYASLSKRRLDVKIPPIGTYDDTFKIQLPPGVKIVSGPEDATASTRFGSYSVKVEKQQSRIVVRSRLVVKVTRVEVADYAAWQKFCMDADKAFSPRLVVGP